MSDIDRAVGIETEAAHRAANDGPEPPTPSVCVICGKESTPTDSGWVENPFLDGQGEADGPWWAGDDLPEAYERNGELICCNRCNSQFMYDHSTEDEKTALNAVVDACRTLSEYGELATTVINRFALGYVERMDGYADDLLNAIHDDANNPPAWLNRDTAESELWSATHRASIRLEYIGAMHDPDGKCKALSAELKTALKLK